MRINGYKLNKLLNIDNLKDFEPLDPWCIYNIYCGSNQIVRLKDRVRIEIYNHNSTKYIGADYLNLYDALELWDRKEINNEEYYDNKPSRAKRV